MPASRVRAGKALRNLSGFADLVAEIGALSGKCHPLSCPHQEMPIALRIRRFPPWPHGRLGQHRLCIAPGGRVAEVDRSARHLHLCEVLFYSGRLRRESRILARRTRGIYELKIVVFHDDRRPKTW